MNTPIIQIDSSSESSEKAQEIDVPKRRCGKIRKKDEKIIMKGLRSFRPMYLIARDLEVSRQALYMYVKDKMGLEIKNVREAMIDIAEAKLMQNIADGNQNAIQFFLDRQARHRGYGEKQQLDRQDIPIINIGTIQMKPLETTPTLVNVEDNKDNAVIEVQEATVVESKQ